MNRPCDLHTLTLHLRTLPLNQPYNSCNAQRTNEPLLKHPLSAATFPRLILTRTDSWPRNPDVATENSRIRSA